jgi:membrane dipeptidase
MNLSNPETNHPSTADALWVIDGHEDIAWNGLEYGRNPSTSAYSSRLADYQNGVTQLTGTRTLGLPEWISGRVGIVFSTIFVEPAAANTPSPSRMVYHNSEEASRFGLEQIAFYRALAERDAHFRIITNQRELDEIVSYWSQNQDGLNAAVGFVLLMEGADPIVKPEDVHTWAQAGLRLIGLSWSGTRYAGGTHAPGPLTDLGRQLLKEMESAKMILDLSHCAEEAYLEAVDTYGGVIIASHSNPRRFLPTDRGLSDEMILKLVKRDGVIGIVPYNAFLNPNWKTGNPRLSIDKVVEAIDYIVQLAGNARYVAIGTDFDGGFGSESIPEGMDTIADIFKISSALDRKGYTQEAIYAIMHQNWLRILRRGLP